MTGRLGTWWKNLTGKDGKGRVRVLVAVGLVGMGLIALSELWPTDGGKESREPSITVTATEAELALEERIAALLGQVAGVGKCRVLVTLERDTQKVYAANTATSANGSSEQVLVVDTDTGPVGLPLTTLLPTVKGVAVVCAGGDDPAVCQRVVEVVATAFHISDRRVCVAPLQ